MPPTFGILGILGIWHQNGRGEPLTLLDDRRVEPIPLGRIQVAMAVVREEQRQHPSGADAVPEGLLVAARVRDDAVQAGHLAGPELGRHLAVGHETRVGADQQLGRGGRPFERNVQLVERFGPQPLGLHRIVRFTELAGERRQGRRLVAFEQSRRGDVRQMVAGDETELDFRDRFSEGDGQEANPKSKRPKPAVRWSAGSRVRWSAGLKAPPCSLLLEATSA